MASAEVPRLASRDSGSTPLDPSRSWCTARSCCRCKPPAMHQLSLRASRRKASTTPLWLRTHPISGFLPLPLVARLTVSAGRATVSPALLFPRLMGRSVRNAKVSGGTWNLVCMQINELLWPRWRLARSEAEVAWGSSCPSSGPLLVSDHRVLLVSDVQAVLQPMVPAAHQRHQSFWHGRAAVSSRALA